MRHLRCYACSCHCWRLLLVLRYVEQSHGLQELTNDRLGSEADLTRLLGTLRYLHGLKAARQHVESAATSSQSNLEQHEASASTTPGQILIGA